jgi:AmiR/NasT family two-component response regulator
MSEERLRIAVADDDRDIREYLEEVLPRLGYEVTASAANGKQLAEQVRRQRPDLVVTDIKMPDMDGIELAQEINRHAQVPVILLSAHHDADLVSRASADHIMAYLVKPINEADLKTAIPIAMLRFRHFQALAEEAASLRQALEDRKLIEKAKGILMRRLRVDEEDAFRRLRMLASSQNRKLIEVGREIAEADEVFRRLEGIVTREKGR